MSLFSVKQSLPLSVLFAFLSGLFLTLATASTYIPAHIDIIASRWLEEKENNIVEESKDDGNNSNTTTTNDNNKNKKNNRELFVDDDIESQQEQEQEGKHHHKTRRNKEEARPKKVSKRMWKIVRTYPAAAANSIYCIVLVLKHAILEFPLFSSWSSFTFALLTSFASCFLLLFPTTAFLIVLTVTLLLCLYNNHDYSFHQFYYYMHRHTSPISSL